MGDTVTVIIGAVMTILIFSYLLGDNILYRWALAILVGAAAGYAMGIAVRFVINEWIAVAIEAPDPTYGLLYMVPLLLGALLIFKGFPPTRLLVRLSVIGNIPLGYIVGVGAGVAISGALTGTLLPQIIATGEAVQWDAGLFRIIEGLILIVATIAVLLFFTAKPQKATAASLATQSAQSWRQRAKGIGQFFLMVGLGAAFAGVISSALTALVIRLWHLVDLLGQATSLLGG